MISDVPKKNFADNEVRAIKSNKVVIFFKRIGSSKIGVERIS